MTATPRLDAQWLAARKAAGAAFDAKDAVGMIEHESRADLIDAQRTLVGYAERLARRLTLLAQRLEAEAGDAPWINSLGEVQGSALEIDLLCARIDTLRKTVDGVAVARRATER